jgi:hypothetical protein
MNIQLYSFIYYKTPLPSGEYLQFFKHNYHYLSGLNKAIVSSKIASTPPPVVPQRNDLEVKLREFEDSLNAKLNTRIQQSTTSATPLNFQEITPLDIQPLKNTEEPSNPLQMIF